jgi:hypothetical protein
MPTYSALNHKKRFGDNQKIFPYQKKSEGIRIIDERGNIDA